MFSKALMEETRDTFTKEAVYSELKNQKILVVDDAALNRELIISYLESDGYTNVQVAEDGKTALELVDSFVPDLIILDLIMPGISGFEVIKTLRSQKGLLSIPIIVQTAISDPEQRIEAWIGGANDVITKPIHRLELLSRVNVQLKTNLLLRKLEDYHGTAETDIKQAFELQRSLLPSSELIKNLEAKHKISLKALFKPSRFLSGDLWGVIDISDTQMGIWICDFSGKGIKAALNTFRIHTIIQEYHYCADEPAELLDALNNRLVELLNIGQFATFLTGVIDFKENRFSYAAASSTHPLLTFPTKKSFQVGDGSGLPLGVAAEQLYPLRHLPFFPGTRLTLHSDVLWECETLDQVNLREENLPIIFEHLKGNSLIEWFLKKFQNWTTLQLSDDLTLIEVTRHRDKYHD